MTLSEPTIISQEAPNPHRFWWLKRIAVLVLVALAGLTVLRWLWAREADRRSAALIADAKARGEPILPEDFEAAKVPDADNAAILFSQAASVLVLSPAFGKLQTPDEDKPL